MTIRNTSAVVDSYTVTVLGDAATWATVTPASVSLFPGADGTAEIRFRPPRNSSVRAGAVDFAVRVTSTQSDDSVVEEGVATIEPFTEIAARITPRTSEGKRKAKHVVAIDNKGNAPVTVSVVASDPDEALAFQSTPPDVTIQPGDSEAVAIGVAARKGFARGPQQHRPFQTVVTPSPAGTQPPVTLDANFVQKAGMPGFIPALVAAAVVLIAAVIIVPGLTQKDGDKKGTFSLTGASGDTTTTVAAAAVEGGEEGEAEAEPAEGAGGGETAGGQSGGEQAGGGGAAPPTTIASSGGGAVKPGVTTTVAPSEDEPTATTAPDAAPVTSTTIPPSTTTTTTPPFATADKFQGSWFPADGSVGCIAIQRSSTSMLVTFKSGSSAESATGSASDANDGNFSVTFKASGATQTYQQLTASTMRVTTSTPFSRGTIKDYGLSRATC